MKLTRIAVLWSVLAVLALPAMAEQSPYVGIEGRSLKALSQEEIADLAAGRGMGLALAAELNGYPGPRHVIDLADELQLSPGQRTRTQAQLAAMKVETIAIGQRIIDDETALDRLFAEETATRATLDDLASKIGVAQGQLRAAHLRYHLTMMEILLPEQVARYGELRGYATDSHRTHGAH